MNIEQVLKQEKGFLICLQNTVFAKEIILRKNPPFYIQQKSLQNIAEKENFKLSCKTSFAT